MLRKKNMNLWINSYLLERFARKLYKKKSHEPKHILFCFVDHFEPTWNKADYKRHIIIHIELP